MRECWDSADSTAAVKDKVRPVFFRLDGTTHALNQDSHLRDSHVIPDIGLNSA